MILSIDIGTTGLKLALYDSDGKAVRALRRHTPLVPRAFGTVDADSIFAEMLGGVKEIVSESDFGGRVEVIGVDGQMGGIIGVDRFWNPVICFDPPINGNYRSSMNSLRDEALESIIAETGSIPVNGTKIMYWMREHPDLIKKTEKFLSLAGYVTGKMAGLKTENAYLDCTSVYLFALGTESGWSPEVCGMLDIPESLLPQIRKSTDIIGTLTEDISRECGLKNGIPLIAGCGDTAASILGAGIREENDAFDIAGTCSVFGVCSAKKMSDRENKALLRMKAPLDDDSYYYTGICFGGEIHSWFMSHIAMRAERDGDCEAVMEEARSIAPGSEGLMFFPYLGGSFTPPDYLMRGAWFGLDWRHTSTHLYRSLLESIGYEYRYYRSVYQELRGGDLPEKITVTGSGSRNSLWNQVKADILGSRLVIPKRTDNETLGTAILCGRASGIIDDPGKTLRSCIFSAEEFYFDEESKKKYDELSERFMEHKKALAGLLHEK